MRYRWSVEEETRLEVLAGDRPWPLVVRAYNTWAAQHGYSDRTALALERRAQAMGVYRRSEGEWITTGAVARILGVSKAQPLRWVRRGQVPSWRNGLGPPCPHYISRTELRKWARHDPSFWRSFAFERLVVLFDAEQVAHYVYAACTPEQGRRPYQRCKPVRCVETGQRFASISDAAQAAFVTPSRMSAVLDTHETANGLHWQTLA